MRIEGDCRGCEVRTSGVFCLGICVLDVGEDFAVEAGTGFGSGCGRVLGGEDFAEFGSGEDAGHVEIGVELEVGVGFVEDGGAEALG